MLFIVLIIFLRLKANNARSYSFTKSHNAHHMRIGINIFGSIHHADIPPIIPIIHHTTDDTKRKVLVLPFNNEIIAIGKSHALIAPTIILTAITSLNTNHHSTISTNRPNIYRLITRTIVSFGLSLCVRNAK